MEQTIRKLDDLMGWNDRMRLHLPPILATFFITIYAQLICPFIAGQSFQKVFVTLSALACLHVILQELLFRFWRVSNHRLNIARHAFWLSVFTWIMMGAVAMEVHHLLYPDFPWGSHLKLMSGYLFLGSGLFAQWEHSEWDSIVRRHGLGDQTGSLKTRILEAFFLFTTIPVITLFVMIWRYVQEGDIHRAILIELFFLGLCFIGVALLIAIRFGQQIGRDVDDLLLGLDRVERGELNVRLDIARANEFGRLAQGINQMAQGLIMRDRIKSAFGHFVNPKVAEDFLRRYDQDDSQLLGGHKQELTILMCDLRDFTPLSESLDPQELIEVLNGYFTEMVTVIRAHDGIVDKFMGDAVMAIFGLHKESDAHPERDAVLAAIEMLSALDHHNHHRHTRDPNCLPLRAGIGLHVGEVVAGYLGSNDRLEFTVIGESVNLAARIEGKTKSPAPPILMSEDLARKVAPLIPVEEVMRTRLKGVSRELTLFAPSAVISETDDVSGTV